MPSIKQADCNLIFAFIFEEHFHLRRINNLCGKNLKRLWLEQITQLSQRKLALKLQVMGYEVDNHFIRRVENGERYVADIELKILSEALGVSFKGLIG